MKAAVLFAHNEPFRVLEVKLASPGAGEVQVRLTATGVCASDWHTATGAIPSPLPAVLGHEGAGVVERVGEGVTLVAPGDHVVLSWIPACGRCSYCESGRANLCAVAAPALLAGSLVSGQRRLSYEGAPLYHYSFLSTFAQRAVVDEASCIPIRRDVSLSVAALIGCAVTTGYGAVINRAQVSPGSSVLVFGAGGVGLSAVMAAALAGAAPIVIVDPVGWKRDLALELGATHALHPGETDIPAAVRDLTVGEGADYAFDAAGAPGLVQEAFAATRRGATIVAVGIPKAGTTVSLPGPELVREEKVVTGSLYGSCRPRQDMPRILDLYAAGRLALDKLVTRTFQLDEINDVFHQMRAGDLTRGVIEFG